MTVTGREELFREISFIGYYVHWPEEQILKLPSLSRKKYCGEIPRINRKINGEKNLFGL